jgi:diguanylate cyclase (GGDEF)-like protein/PAS domain S-box-containing protein
MDLADAQAKIVRLEKVVRALMDRAERSTTSQGSDFSTFQARIMLEGQVRRRTAELEAAVRENERVNRAWRESESRFRGVVSQSLVGIVVIDDGKITYSNGKFDETFGYSAEEVRGMSPLDFVTEGDRAHVAETMRQRVSGEVESVSYSFRGRCKDGAEIEIECHGSTFDAGGHLSLVSMTIDITERTRAERAVLRLQEQLREQSTRDPLTGLYNRRYLEDHLARDLIRAERAEDPVSVIMFDLDHFKIINDTAGHLAGDEVLRIVAGVIKAHSRASDICCRYGGEEFLMILPGMPEAAAITRAERLREVIATTCVDHEGSPIRMTASLGVAAFPGDGATGDQLIAAADRALYAAKRSGRNRVNGPHAPIVGS